MTSLSARSPVWIAFVAVAASCGTESNELPSAPDVAATLQVGFDALPWSEPVWLGPVVNSPALDIGPTLSRDGLSLYFTSARESESSVGGFDLWVSRRTGVACAWEQPVNLGPMINTNVNEGNAALSTDGRLLFFGSHGHGSVGGSADIFVSRRTDPDDDLSWGPPVSLGPEVNTEEEEGGHGWLQAGPDGPELYFSRAGTIHRVPVTTDGMPRGPAVEVEELNDPLAEDPFAGGFRPSVRADGREVIFGARPGTRTGGVGLSDIWVSTRRSVNEPWSTPRNLGRPVNSPFADLEATLSANGRTLVFASAARARGGLGRQDLWMSTRTPAAEESMGESTCRTGRADVTGSSGG